MDEPCFYRVSVKGIVVDDKGRILLAKEEDGVWELLGGGLEHNEEPIDCLRREILEETGLRVTWVSDTPKYFITAPRRHKPTFTANVIYQIELENLNFTPSDECQELRFFTLEEMQRLDLFPNVRELLKVLGRSKPELPK